MILINDEKHFNTLNNYYKKIYGKKVFKIALNGDFTCPNKDGSKGFGGCIYCSSSGSGDFAGDVNEPIELQFKKGLEMMKNKWPDAYYIPYLQANSNTYGDIKKLRELYYKLIDLDKNVVQISISTRPDCLNEEIYELLSEINKIKPVQIELGLQSIFESTSKLINRGHDLNCFHDACLELKKRNIEVVAHIINGLPYETYDMMIETAKYLNGLVNGVKIHMLHIMKNTKILKMYEENNFHLLSLDEYVKIVVDQIRHLDENIIIHRVTGDSPKELLVAPTWTLKKFVVMNEIDKNMRNNNYYQGDLIKKE